MEKKNRRRESEQNKKKIKKNSIKRTRQSKWHVDETKKKEKEKKKIRLFLATQLESNVNEKRFRVRLSSASHDRAYDRNNISTARWSRTVRFRAETSPDCQD